MIKHVILTPAQRSRLESGRTVKGAIRINPFTKEVEFKAYNYSYLYQPAACLLFPCPFPRREAGGEGDEPYERQCASPERIIDFRHRRPTRPARILGKGVRE